MKSRKFKAFIKMTNYLLIVIYAFSLAYGKAGFVHELPIIVQTIPFVISLGIAIVFDDKDEEQK